MEGGSKGNKGNPYGQMCQSLLDLYDAADNVFNTISARVRYFLALCLLLSICNIKHLI
jgi:hypothetical protein